MKKWLQVLKLALVLGVGGPVLYYGGLLGFYGLSVAFGRDTAYAPGCTEAKFQEIRPGMSRKEVERRLGPGFWQSDDGKVVGYTRSPTGTHYDDRRVVYDHDQVAEVISDIYFD